MSKKLTKVILIAALFTVLIGSQAFAYKYVMNDAATFSYVSATTQIAVLTGGSLDDGYYDYALGDFDFYYYGRKVTHMRISTNGYIVCGFGSATGNGVAWSHTAIPDNATPEGVVAVNWADWTLTPHGTMWYDVIGTAPNRTLVIEWRDIPSLEQLYENYRFEVIFYETSNEIRFQYDNVEEASSHDFGNKSTVGVEHPTSLQAEQYSFNTSDLSNDQAILFTPFVHVYDNTDFDGDGVPEFTIFRPSNHSWYMKDFGARTTPTAKGDVPVPGDYDGDGKAFWAEYLPSTSTWYTELGEIIYGTEGDIPVPADYDGDGITDIAVWRPSNGLWYVYGWGARTLGMAGDIPVPADVDGDGADEFVVWRPSNGTWYVYGLGDLAYGAAGDIPVPGDYNAGGMLDGALFRPSNGMWYIWYSETSTTQVRAYGIDGDIPVPGDYLGDGLTRIAVWRPSNGLWYIRGVGAIAYGILADVPMIR